jgi:hypothetical protein
MANKAMNLSSGHDDFHFDFDIPQDRRAVLIRAATARAKAIPMVKPINFHRPSRRSAQE